MGEDHVPGAKDGRPSWLVTVRETVLSRMGWKSPVTIKGSCGHHVCKREKFR